jgi:4-amino-4-deoxy-L-arabinose transferase-like glycosyltransferase
MTRTYDEKRQLAYGLNVLHGSWARISKYDNSKMPITALNALPSFLAGYVTRPDWLNQLMTSLALARSITMLASLLLASFVYRWSRELYGDRAGSLSLLLYAFSPSFIAHATLVTTDVFAACALTIATYHFWRFLRERTWRSGIVSALTLGVAQVVKYTSLFLYPIFALLLAARIIADSATRRRSPDGTTVRRLVWPVAKWTIVYALASILIIHLAFGFQGSFTPISAFQFKSAVFRRLQSSALHVADLRVPLPYSYLQGLDWVIHDERSGTTAGDVYLLGEVRPGAEGFLGYFFYAFLFKEPLASQALILWAGAAYVLRRGSFRFRENELFLLCPVAVFTVYFNFLFHEQIGFRFFLVALPFLHVFCGSLRADFRSASKTENAALVILCTYLVGSVLSYFPFYLSYFNELVLDRKKSYRILADSNIDWGQCRWYLERYERDHPEAIVEPDAPVAGRIVVGVNLLTGIVRSLKGHPVGPEKYRWLRDHFQPIDHVAHCYLVFDVSPDALQAALGAPAGR